MLQLSKLVMHEFSYHYVKQKYGGKAKLGYIDTNTASLYRLKQRMFIKTFQEMLRQGLIFQIMNYTDHCLKEKTKQ